MGNKTSYFITGLIAGVAATLLYDAMKTKGMQSTPEEKLNATGNPALPSTSSSSSGSKATTKQQTVNKSQASVHYTDADINNIWAAAGAKYKKGKAFILRQSQRVPIVTMPSTGGWRNTGESVVIPVNTSLKIMGIWVEITRIAHKGGYDNSYNIYVLAQTASGKIILVNSVFGK